jgi:hypothetical protein
MNKEKKLSLKKHIAITSFKNLLKNITNEFTLDEDVLLRHAKKITEEHLIKGCQKIFQDVQVQIDLQKDSELNLDNFLFLMLKGILYTNRQLDWQHTPKFISFLSNESDLTWRIYKLTIKGVENYLLNHAEELWEKINNTEPT